LIASLSMQRDGEALMLEGVANVSTFECYIEQILVPSIEKGQIVVSHGQFEYSPGKTGAPSHRS
jgi:hypothetical protein